jgi:hypothetical protein
VLSQLYVKRTIFARRVCLLARIQGSGPKARRSDDRISISSGSESDDCSHGKTERESRARVGGRRERGVKQPRDCFRYFRARRG